MLKFFILIYTLLFSLLIISAYNQKFKRYYVILKALCSFGFVMVAVVGNFYTDSINNLIWVLPSLVFYMIGDIFICFKATKALLLTGAGSFLIGHLIMIISIYSRTPIKLVDFVIPAACVIILWVLSSLDSIDVGSFKKPALIYSFFLSWVSSKTFFMMINNDFTRRSSLFSVGYLLLFVSDFTIFFMLFYSRKFKYFKLFELLTYYYGMFLIAVSTFI